LPPKLTAIYMYSPLTACLFVPFALMTPQAALICWQVASIAGVAACAFLFARIVNRPIGSLLWIPFLFLPVFHTLLIGHIGILLGMLPLALGFFLLMKERPVPAGLAWSLLLLKPQFLPGAFLVAGALALTGKWRCAIGLAAGMAVVTMSMFLCLGPAVAFDWLHSFRLSDTIFTFPGYSYPHYLVCSLPGVLIQSAPTQFHSAAKMAGYIIGAAIGLHALWFSRKLLRESDNTRLPFVFIIGLTVLPFVLPHFLFYDMCVFALAGMLIYGYTWGDWDRALKRDAALGLLACNLYLVLWMFISTSLAQPIVLIVIWAELYRRLLKYGGTWGLSDSGAMSGAKL
jgi:hypothetical protein